MPHLLHRDEDADELAQLGADPELRGKVGVDGLLINGQDALAERRRMMREMHQAALRKERKDRRGR